MLNKQISIQDKYLPSPFPVTTTRSRHPFKLLNCNSFLQEQIFITTRFYLEQFLIGTIYLLRKFSNELNLTQFRYCLIKLLN